MDRHMDRWTDGRRSVKRFHIKKKKNVLHGQQGSLHGSSSWYGALRQRGLLDPIKLAYDQRRPDGQLKLTASAFNRLGQSWSQDLLLCRTRCFFPGDGGNHRQYSLCLPRRDGQAELTWVAG